MSEPKTILIVEDELDAAEMLAEMMRVSGYRVLKAYSSGPALMLLSVEVPDLVLLDIMMPDISGLEVLRYIRREPRLQHIPVIILSAKNLPSDIKAGLDAGATLYLTKPIGYQELKSAIEKVLTTGG
ncbi:MAG: response regulator transcription factor [Anaerolineales bacterium]